MKNNYTIQLFCRICGAASMPCTDTTDVRASLSEQKQDGAATRLTATWRNTGSTTILLQPEIRVQTEFVCTHYVIPAVLYNGNAWGRGNEPKGLAHNGEAWVFDHRRASIPACTISENAQQFLALFASNDTPQSLNASCSMTSCADGTMLHRLLYPGMEKPLTYRNRDQFDAPHEAFITLEAGEIFRTTAYLLCGQTARPYFAAAQVQDAALDLLASPFKARYTPDTVQTLCCAFAQWLLVETAGHRLICTGRQPDQHDGFAPRMDFEFGWCGQNGMYARLFLEHGLETKNPDLVRTGTDILDFWAGSTGKTGLMYVRFDDKLIGDGKADICNLSYAIAELAKAYWILKAHGVTKARWLAAAERIADFLIARFDAKNGFGKMWDVETGACLDSGGTIGAFMIPALCELYRVTEKAQYLQYAQAACRLYRTRDLARFLCTAGALDTCCIDKETSGPLLAGGIMLYEMTNEPEWLDCALMAGQYFCSWMFHHDTLPIPGSDFARYGLRTLGGTSVSAQHHHLDPWGALVVPYLLRLSQYTADQRWQTRADLIWANALQNIAPEEGVRMHGRMRPAGAQNEGYFHCAWGSADAPGAVNDWLVAWPQAFCWNTARYLRAFRP